jgi:hypothetical protein
MSLFPDMNEDLFSEYGGSNFQGFDLDGGNGGAADGSFVLSHGNVDSSAPSSAASSGVSGMSAVSGASGTSDASASASSGASGMSVSSTPSVLMNANANASKNVSTVNGTGSAHTADVAGSVTAVGQLLESQKMLQATMLNHQARQVRW